MPTRAKTSPAGRLRCALDRVLQGRQVTNLAGEARFFDLTNSPRYLADSAAAIRSSRLKRQAEVRLGWLGRADRNDRRRIQLVRGRIFS